MSNYNVINRTIAKPFLKWAGGKTQLMQQITSNFPIELEIGIINRYVEPFIGGGAVYFYVAQNYKIDEFVIADINEELILCYKTIKRDVQAVIENLQILSEKYLGLNEKGREEFYYKQRKIYNTYRVKINYKRYDESWIERTAQVIFLNKTCYNGLFRMNSRGEFNTPFGRYKNPKILDEENLLSVSNLLKNTKIISSDFSKTQKYVDNKTFVYLDPPYRPISKTANFTSYSKYEFGNAAQLKLASFYRMLDDIGAKILLSNSDPQNEDPNDNFFCEQYDGFRIDKVKASRMINCDAGKRGQINELLIMNY